ncbi:Hint domain-containing protein [Paracoccus sp. SCSIO 75233]|uniref:Hint domain-containing protein n=1 Tax=Paracoccus sp. SCSIO 75233 TaxID=3017782 RepID=UPI0022EFE235|nr:Hint domain-containing protein [Paracoccus sp. SCSIO 75233]WBU54110.1 Hint domain-containing protein [Paracoccus sp. SCSIO 75233]
MANISDIQTFILSGVVPTIAVDQNNNYQPNQILGNTYAIPGELDRMNFIDGNGDGDLNDHEQVHTGMSGETGTNGDRLQINGTTYFVQSMFHTNITVNFSDGTSQTYAGGARTFVIARTGVNTLTGDVVVNPVNSVRTAITAYKNAAPGRKIVSLTVNSFGADPLDNTTMAAQSDIFCFASGTLIETRAGMVPVERLKIGTELRTLDHGYQRIRWIGATRLSGDDLTANPKLRPIRIRAGALGQRLPERDLVVSRQHRVLVRSPLVPDMFGADEILVPAIKLTALDGVEIEEQRVGVIYWHILFDQHEVIFSEGMPTESLFTGPEMLKTLSPEAREEIEMLFPQFFASGFLAEPVRQIPDGKRLKLFMERQSQVGQPLLSGWPHPE